MCQLFMSSLSQARFSSLGTTDLFISDKSRRNKSTRLIRSKKTRTPGTSEARAIATNAMMKQDDRSSGALVFLRTEALVLFVEMPRSDLISSTRAARALSLSFRFFSSSARLRTGFGGTWIK